MFVFILNNNIYLITDADELSAKNLAYDDSETVLGVNNVQDAIVEQNKKMGNLIKRETLTKTPDAKGNMFLKSNNIIPLFIIVTSVENEVFLHKFASYNGYPYARLYDSNNNVITTQITFDLYYLEL